MKCIFIIFLSAYFISKCQAKFYVVRQWKYINFTWPNEESLREAQSKGLYIPQNIIISGVNFYDNYYYITLPRMKRGVPVTLARIEAGFTKDSSPDLEPFPSWNMNDVEDCNNLQNVQNVEIDTKGRMWIIDGGRIETLSGPIIKCTPKLIVYDIKENKTNVVYHFPENVASKNNSFLYGIVVDNTDGGYAYITDNSQNDPGIIVYSLEQNSSWKIRHEKSMLADPSASHFTVDGIHISSPLNIAGIALGPKLQTSNDRITLNEDREVYFSPLSSLHIFSINTTTLRNENLTENSMEIEKSIKDVGMKASQSSAMLMDNQGMLYYTLLSDYSIGKWDTHTPFVSGQKIIAQDDKYLEWANSLAFDSSGNLTVLVNRLERFIYDRLNLSEYNFRLISANVGGKSYLEDDSLNYNMGQNTKPEITSDINNTEVNVEKMNSSIGTSISPVRQENTTPVFQSSGDRIKLTISTLGLISLLLFWL